MLNSAIAQSIVDITMSVLHVNVNIMDVNGTVIAAGDKSRIGTFHCAAAEVIATGQKKAVSAQEAATMDNVEPGATYPIVYKGEVIGALGMTGAPEYVDKFVELGALYALLFIEQEDMKQRVFQEQLDLPRIFHLQISGQKDGGDHEHRHDDPGNDHGLRYTAQDRNFKHRLAVQLIHEFGN